jgi:hypothetical protein
MLHRDKKPRFTQSQFEERILNIAEMSNWAIADFQRDLQETARVRMVADEIRAGGGEVPGVIELGTVARDHNIYLLDGQHRRHAAKLSGLTEFWVRSRTRMFETMADMGLEYVILNSKIVQHRSDHVLKGLLGTLPEMQRVHEECPFVGFVQVRRNDRSPVLSMSSTLKSWETSAGDPPSHSGRAAITVAQEMDSEETTSLIRFLRLAHAAWGTDTPYRRRLWSQLNLVLCMWLYRQLMLSPETRLRRSTVLTDSQFKKCLMALSAEPNYLDWLGGRSIRDTDRSPGFTRIKAIFVSRLRQEGIATPRLPSPSWASN